MEALLFYHSPIFSLTMMKIGFEDQELGQSISLLADSCWQGALYGAGSSDSCGVLDGAFTVVFSGGFEEIDIPGGITG
jgi:fructose-1,6-bisphosphatase/inositol monophosphatase family enzyme